MTYNLRLRKKMKICFPRKHVSYEINLINNNSMIQNDEMYNKQARKIINVYSSKLLL